jgi:hypothetical protein
VLVSGCTAVGSGPRSVSVAVYGDSITEFAATRTSDNSIHDALLGGGFAPLVHGHSSCGYVTKAGDNPWWHDTIRADRTNGDRPLVALIELGLDDIFWPADRLVREMPAAIDDVIRAFPSYTRIGLVLPAPQPEFASSFADGVAAVRNGVAAAPARFPDRRVVVLDVLPEFEDHWDEYGAADHIHYTDAGRLVFAALLERWAPERLTAVA